MLGLIMGSTAAHANTMKMNLITAGPGVIKVGGITRGEGQGSSMSEVRRGARARGHQGREAPRKLQTSACREVRTTRAIHS